MTGLPIQKANERKNKTTSLPVVKILLSSSSSVCFPESGPAVVVGVPSGSTDSEAVTLGVGFSVVVVVVVVVVNAPLVVVVFALVVVVVGGVVVVAGLVVVFFVVVVVAGVGVVVVGVVVVVAIVVVVVGVVVVATSPAINDGVVEEHFWCALYICY